MVQCSGYQQQIYTNINMISNRMCSCGSLYWDYYASTKLYNMRFSSRYLGDLIFSMMDAAKLINI